MKRKHTMTIFFGVTLLQYMAANFAHPITPTLIVDLQLRDYMFGAAFAAMSLTNFLFSPFWGKMREYFSIRWLLLIGCAGYGFGQYLFGSASTELGIILARCVSGFFVGSVSVSTLIYITERSKPGKTGENLARLVIIQALGAAAGYLLGGAIGVYSIKVTFASQAIVLAGSGALFFLAMRDNPPRDGASEYGDSTNGASAGGADRSVRIRTDIRIDRSFWREINPLKAFWDCRSFMTRSLAIIFAVVTVASLGSNAFDQSFNYFLKAQFRLTPIYNGVLKAITGIVTLAAVGTICMRIMRGSRIRLATGAALACCAVSIAAVLAVSNRALFMGLSLVFSSFNAIYTPLLQDCVARESNECNRNMLMGLYNATRSLGMIGGALFAGFLYKYGAKLPFMFAGACFVLASSVILSIARRRPEPRL